MASPASNITGAFCFGSAAHTWRYLGRTVTPRVRHHKLNINSHRTRNLLPAVLIGDVRKSPFRQQRWLLRGLLRQRAPTRLDSCCGDLSPSSRSRHLTRRCHRPAEQRPRGIGDGARRSQRRCRRRHHPDPQRPARVRDRHRRLRRARPRRPPAAAESAG
jgi:hypothetical protein